MTPLNCQTIKIGRSVKTACNYHRFIYCRTFSLKMHCRDKIGSRYMRGHRIFTSNKFDFTLRALNHFAKFHQNWIKIATVTVFTNRQADTCDFIICPMLCYSNGIDILMWLAVHADLCSFLCCCSFVVCEWMLLFLHLIYVKKLTTLQLCVRILIIFGMRH